MTGYWCCYKVINILGNDNGTVVMYFKKSIYLIYILKYMIYLGFITK